MEVIKLYEGDEKTVVDSVSVEYEDPLGLDSFEDLCNIFHESSEPHGLKSFIMARVETRDHKQPERPYFSYYNAYLLNKILFQNQIVYGDRMIHRLHVVKRYGLL